MEPINLRSFKVKVSKNKRKMKLFLSRLEKMCPEGWMPLLQMWTRKYGRRWIASVVRIAAGR